MPSPTRAVGLLIALTALAAPLATACGTAAEDAPAPARPPRRSHVPGVWRLPGDFVLRGPLPAAARGAYAEPARGGGADGPRLIVTGVRPGRPVGARVLLDAFTGRPVSPGPG
ncbi:hypothetical protein ACGFZL_11605 [Streptomyces sp. NPDC048182]|uniref:hypothetical protein n=1 Tax=Streptomyces sp. NPDC048182 TaxID=3365507 RepID=UPI00371C3904